MGTLNINPVLLHKMKHGGGIVSGYGPLYNWYAASAAYFAPDGWRVATKIDYDNLVTYLGGNTDAAGHMKEAGLLHWASPNTGGDNTSGLTMLPGGQRTFAIFTGKTQSGAYLSGTSFDANTAYRFVLQYDSSLFSWDIQSKNLGQSVRLIKNDSVDPGSLTDYDGNIYQTILIGTQVWIAADWRCTKMNDGTPIPLVADQTAWNALTTPGYCIYP